MPVPVLGVAGMKTRDENQHHAYLQGEDRHNITFTGVKAIKEGLFLEGQSRKMSKRSPGREEPTVRGGVPQEREASSGNQW